MALVNIGQDNKDDGFYRYKMPRLITKIEGRGNGIKTNIVNMVDVAKALARPPSYTTKFFGCVLGAQSKFDDKTGNSTVNGAHDTSKMVELLEDFIKKYVQCYGCGNPETEILVSKKQMITLKCAACGYLSDVDMRDKLTTFIVNHPPEKKRPKGSKDMRRAEKERMDAGDLADKKPVKGGTKKGKSSKKDAGADGDTSPPGSEDSGMPDNDEDDIEWQTDTSAEAAEQRRREQLSAVTSEMVMLNTEGEDGGKEKKKDKKKDATSNGDANGTTEGSKDAIKDDAVDGGDADRAASKKAEVDKEEAYKVLFAEVDDFVKTHKLSEVGAWISNQLAVIAGGEGGEAGPESGAAPATGRQAALLCALLEALSADVTKGVHKELEKKQVVFEAAIVPDEESEGDDAAASRQLALLYGLERFFGERNIGTIKEAPLAMKVFYDSDVLEEEQILSWYDSDGSLAASAAADVAPDASEAVRKAAAPFVEWLREAEEDEEEE